MTTIYIWRDVMCGCYTPGIVISSGKTKNAAIEKVIQKFAEDQKNTGTWNPDDDSDLSDSCDSNEPTPQQFRINMLKKELSSQIPEEVLPQDVVCWQGGGD